MGAGCDTASDCAEDVWSGSPTKRKALGAGRQNARYPPRLPGSPPGSPPYRRQHPAGADHGRRNDDHPHRSPACRSSGSRTELPAHRLARPAAAQAPVRARRTCRDGADEERFARGAAGAGAGPRLAGGGRRTKAGTGHHQGRPVGDRYRYQQAVGRGSTKRCRANADRNSGQRDLVFHGSCRWTCWRRCSRGRAGTNPHKRPRADSKLAILVKLLSRNEGATVEEMAAATGWQAYTVRGVMSGALANKFGAVVASEKVEGGGRIYRASEGFRPAELHRHSIGPDCIGNIRRVARVICDPKGCPP
jgi:hypothetical protein